jgi:beta propeller repeat protein
MPPGGAEASLMSVRSFVHISAVALAFTAAAVFGSMRPTAQQSVVIAGVTTQVTRDPGRQGDPSISGSVVVWTDQRHGNDDIFYRDGLGPEVQLTNSPINQNVHDVSGRIVVCSDRTQPGFVRAIDLTTNTEIGPERRGRASTGLTGAFALPSPNRAKTNFSGKSNESSDHLL